jgi:ech hydrogenase subunit F
MEDTLLVMLKTSIRSLFCGSACKMYPLREATVYERTRGHIVIEASKCIVCTLCAVRCPTGAILVDRDKYVWMIDRFKCILCGNCVEACKANALRMDQHYAGPVVRKGTEQYTVTPRKARHGKTIEKPSSPGGE